MNPALAGLACVVVAGAVVAVGARETRAALLGLLVALLASAFLADPLPSPLSIAARLVAALLGCRLIAIAIRGEAGGTEGSRLGWPVDLVLAGAAAVIGFGTHGLGVPGGGPPEAQAAGFAVGIVAAAPLVTGRDVFRLSVGAVLVVLASLLVRAGLSGTPNELEQLVTSGLIAGLGGAIGVVVMGARAAGQSLLVADAGGRTIDPVKSTHLREPREPVEERVRGAHPVAAPSEATPRR